jgi:photosynthetic reaction center cytochrome c subunit
MKPEFYKTFNFLFGTAVAAIATAAFLVVTFERPGTTEVQMGFRGTAMEVVYNNRNLDRIQARNIVPAALEAVEDDPTSPRASEVYENVRVLGHLSVEQFGRIMQAMTEWIYPNPEDPAAGCNGCHVPGNFAAEDIYTKHVARRMLQMVHTINSTYSNHVQDVGVTCYTCHRGQAVPAAVWSQAPSNAPASRTWQVAGEQNRPVTATGYATLPSDPFTPYLWRDEPIRHLSDTARQRDNNASIIQAEWVYGLMMHMSTSLGVNCTFCHNSRSFASWETSTPQRVTAWHGIRMVRAINNDYIEPLRERFPPNRLGPLGDTLKVNCTTCHQGVYQPLYGAPMLRDYPELNPPPRRADAGAQPARN